MLETRKDLKDKIEAQSAEITDLENQLETLNSERGEAVEEQARLAEQLAEANELNRQLEDGNTELTGKLEAAETKIAQLEAELANEPQRLAEEAARQLAESGHEPVETVEPVKMTEEQFNAHYNSIEDGRERAKWYLANKHLIGR